MKKKILALFILAAACTVSVYGRHPDALTREQLHKVTFESFEQAQREAAAKDIARRSQVDIEIGWGGTPGPKETRCKGVLVNEGRTVVTHAACLTPPYAADNSYQFLRAMLWFKDGYGIGGIDLRAQGAGSFVYWDVSKFELKVPSARLEVAQSSTVFGWAAAAENALSSLRFFFNNKADWKIEDLKAGADKFTLSYALRARVPGEPVFAGSSVVALNAEKDRECIGFYPLNRPVFEAFTERNGGAILQNL